MRIALVSNFFEADKLAAVITTMKRLGPPKIHAVWMECYNHWQALEGCHRLRAAAELGLPPEIIEVDYSDEMCSTVEGYDGDEDYKISKVCDDGNCAEVWEYAD